MTERSESRNSPCPVCSVETAAVVGSKGGREYVRCDGCSLLYDPVMPTAEEFSEAYGKYRTRKRVVFRKCLKLAPMIWRHMLRTRGLRERRGGGHRPMAFLDIGSNTGYNTEAARRLGCEAHGLENSEKAVLFAREEYPSCTFHHSEIVPFANDGHAFDFIYCSEVIEHVPEPHAFVDAIAKLSHEGTLLFLTTPDAGHWKVPDDLMSWKEVIPVEHLRLYDRSNLSHLLAMHGFQVDFSTPMPRANQRLYCSLRD
jgi:2-polyprenyl-3-methyl-5-hydroxy-6-metoxy-1,4-benzoquinol methylase